MDDTRLVKYIVSLTVTCELFITEVGRTNDRSYVKESMFLPSYIFLFLIVFYIMF